ncbi:hypothetical protein H9647_09940 [Paenibacillus sp. Sa2BVA9]|uniref:Transposase n=1 Tax=Paenibacillus gallinarum TaxID=2762232 RepID=A0ABR8SYA5_9BACL|nr:hypothetical protein [Paenibacillus gallinarum]MBD7968385.1 hypothetical protein [Paenibacillus gallinarum]
MIIKRCKDLRQAQKPRGKWTVTLGKEIEQRLHETRSPEQISMRYGLKEQPMVSFKTIYRWLYEGRLIRYTVLQLRHKGKRQKLQERRGRFLVGTSIKQRPKEIRSEKALGTANWTRSSPAEEKARLVSLHVSSEKQGCILLLKCQIALHYPWKSLLV